MFPWAGSCLLPLPSSGCWHFTFLVVPRWLPQLQASQTQNCIGPTEETVCVQGKVAFLASSRQHLTSHKLELCDTFMSKPVTDKDGTTLMIIPSGHSLAN